MSGIKVKYFLRGEDRHIATNFIEAAPRAGDYVKNVDGEHDELLLVSHVIWMTHKRTSAMNRGPLLSEAWVYLIPQSSSAVSKIPSSKIDSRLVDLMSKILDLYDTAFVNAAIDNSQREDFYVSLNDLVSLAEKIENYRCLQALEDMRPLIYWDSSLDHRVQSSIIESCQRKIAIETEDYEDAL